MTHTISKGQDVVDSRDIIARIKELEEERAALVDDIIVADVAADPYMKALAEECEGCGDWEHGATLIHESHWVEYVEDLVIDISDLPKNFATYIVIDWQATADNIAHDYSKVSWGEDRYYIRD